MAFNPPHPDPASSAIDYDDIENNTSNRQSFALVQQPYAQWMPCQWQFLPPSGPSSGGDSFPLPTPGSQSGARHVSEWGMGHEASVRPWPSPRADPTSANASWPYLARHNDAVFASNSLGSPALASYQAPSPMVPDHQLPARNNSLARSAPYQSFMPFALAYPSIPMSLESSAVTMASTMLLQTALRQPKLCGEVVHPPMEPTGSSSMYPQEQHPTSPSSIVVGHGEPDSPAPTSSQGTRAPKRRKVQRSSGQGYQMKELTRRRKHCGNNVFMTFRWQQRPTSSPEDAQTTAVNRKLWTCIEHQNRKTKCDCWTEYVETGPLARLECKFDLGDIRLFRKKPSDGHPLATRRAESPSLEDIIDSVEAPKEIRLSQDSRFKLSGIEGFEHGLTIQVVKFTPDEWDKTSHEWYDGCRQKRHLEMPPYCIASVADTWEEIQRYIEAAIPQYLDYVIHNSSQPVTKAMLRRARAFSKNGRSKMVKAALDMLAVCRMIELDWRIVNPDAIGMKPVNDPASPWHGTVPPTPIMDPILDQIIIRNYLEPMAKLLLSELKTQFYQEAPQNVSEIIFTGFILSTNLQLLLKHSRANAERYRVNRRYYSLDRAKEYIKGHNILLTYIHIMLHGSSGSSQSKRSGQPTGLVVPTCNMWSEDEAEFFRRIQRLLNSIEADLRVMRTNDMYETDMHWSHGIFFPQWTPHPLAIASVS